MKKDFKKENNEEDSDRPGDGDTEGGHGNANIPEKIISDIDDDEESTSSYVSDSVIMANIVAELEDGTLEMKPSLLYDLARLPLDWYEELRKKIARKTGWRVTTLDYEVRRHRQEIAGKSEGPTEVLLRLVDRADLFHTPDDKAYVTMLIEGHYETMQINAHGGFAGLLRKMFYTSEGKPPASQALTDAINILEAKARFDGEEHEVHVRSAMDEDQVYIDLTNDSWEAIKITRYDWEVVKKYPVKFIRTKGNLTLPQPVKGGSLDELRSILNVSDQDWYLIAGWLIAAVYPEGPYPVLVINGEHGSFKSTTTKILRMCVDPSSANLTSFPRSERDLMIRATNSQVLAFDNISGITDSMSDALCRLSTGGGSTTRELYSDREETVFNATRPVILNGINNFIYRPDLLDRAIIIHMPIVADQNRLTETEIYKRFDELHASILCSICDAIAGALDNFSTTNVQELPRMADFVKLVVAAEPALGWEQGTFLKAYDESQARTVESALTDDPVAVELRKIPADPRCGGSFCGTATELLNILNRHVTEDVKRGSWPKTPGSLSKRLRIIAPFLRKVGTDIQFSRIPGERHIEIRKIVSAASDRPDTRSDDANDACDANVSEPDQDRST